MSDDTLTFKANRQAFASILTALKIRKSDLIDAIATIIDKESNPYHHEKELHLVTDTIGKIEKVME